MDHALEIAFKTDTGRARAHNEDAVSVSSKLGLIVLADGMGGHNAGEVASGMATALLAAEFERRLAEKPLASLSGDDAKSWAHVCIRSLIAETNAAIFRAAESQPQYKGMGTTLVVVLFYDNRLTVAHIGDSRLYRLRAGEFLPLTKDHSILQEWIDSGMITPEQALTAQHKNLVTRAMGIEVNVQPEINDYDVLPDDIYLLCSDGLYDMVPDDETAMTLQTLGANLSLAAAQLIDQANDNGGKDNVTVALVKIKDVFAAPEGPWQKFLEWLK